MTTRPTAPTLTARARSVFPSWTDPGTQPLALRAIATYAAQNPGLDFRDYGGGFGSVADHKRAVSGYRTDARRITRDLQRCRDAMRSCVAYRITDDDVIEAARHTFSGRLTLTRRDDGRIGIDYCTGQYWPTEYRAACAAVLEQVAREAYRRAEEEAREEVAGRVFPVAASVHA